MNKTNTILNTIDLMIQSGNLDEAETYILKNVKEKSYKEALLGIINMKRKKIDVARDQLMNAIRLNNDNYLAKGWLGICEVSKKQWRRAEKLLDMAIKEHPEDLNFLLNRAIVHSEKQEFSSSLAITTKLLKNSKNINIYSLHVGALRAEYRFDEALTCLNEAINHYQDSIELRKIRADLYSEINPRMAVNEYNQLASMGELGIATRWNSAFSYLRLGDFERGFEYYEAGLHEGIGRVGRPLPPVVKKLKRIEDICEVSSEHYIVVVTEQGIGDQVLFASALRDLIAQHKKIILIADQRMIPIFKRSFADISVHVFGLLEIIYRYEVIAGYLPIGSLFRLYRKNESSFKQARSVYLAHNQRLVEKFRDHLTKKAGDKRIIGISWKGGFWDRQKKGKSLELENWLPIFKRFEHCEFLCLQYGDIKKEKDWCLHQGISNVTFIEGVDFKKNLDAWHALICSCEEVVSISTAMVHFAAASGVRVHLLLNMKQQPFIWGLDSRESFAYNNIKIYRMQNQESVESYFERIKTELII